MHGMCKHIDVMFHFLSDLTEDRVIELKHSNTQEQLTDILTKPLKLESFVMLGDDLRKKTLTSVT